MQIYGEPEPLSGTTRTLAQHFATIFHVEPNRRFMDWMAPPVSSDQEATGVQREMRFGWELVREVFAALPKLIQDHFKGDKMLDRECWGAISHIVMHFFRLAEKGRLP